MAIGTLSEEQKKLLTEAGAAWTAASKIGDRTAMDKAHADAEAIRAQAGYSGGDTGAKVIELPQAQTPQAPTLPQYQDQSANIGAAYDAQLAAQTAKIQAARDQAVSDYEGQIAGAPETYGAQRAAVDASTARSLQKQNEYAAAKGTAFSGGVASDIGATRGMGEQSKVALTQQETNFVQNLRKAIADTRKAASYEEISASANVQAQKNQALAAEAQNVYKAGYQTAQDTFGNQITAQNQALNAKQTEAQIKATEANIRQSDAATAASLIQQEMANIELAAMKDPNSPENQAKLAAVARAKEELRQLQVSGKYTEAEAKARVESIWANVRQSNASTAATYAGMALDREKFNQSKAEALAKIGTTDVKATLVNSVVTQLEPFFTTGIDTTDGVMDPNQPKARAKAAEWLNAHRAEIIQNTDIATFNSLMSLYGGK